MNESFHCFTHEIGDFKQWTTYKVCNVWLLTLTSIYIWVVRDICVERVWVANSSAIFFYNAIIVPLTTCIRHYIGSHLQKQSFWNCEPLCLTAHKICIPNLSGNLGNVNGFGIFFRPFFCSISCCWQWQRKSLVHWTAIKSKILFNMEIDGNDTIISSIHLFNDGLYSNKRFYSHGFGWWHMF